MKVISFLNSKGGAGKTTAVINVARGLQKRGFSVVAVDTDLHQQSASQWREDAPEDFFRVDVFPLKDLPSRLKGIDADYVLVDGAGTLEKEVVDVATSSDMVIIPVKTSPLDYWPAQRLFESFKSLPTVTAYLLTQARKNTTMAREMAETLEADGSVIDTIIYNRTAYQLSIMKGQTVYELDQVAASEIDGVIDEILGAI